MYRSNTQNYKGRFGCRAAVVRMLSYAKKINSIVALRRRKKSKSKAGCLTGTRRVPGTRQNGITQRVEQGPGSIFFFGGYPFLAGTRRVLPLLLRSRSWVRIAQGTHSSSTIRKRKSVSWRNSMQIDEHEQL